MKNVWILERFISPEEMKKSLQELQELKPVTEDQKKAKAEFINLYAKKIEKNPNGYWLGYEGKCNYKEFCYVAKNFMKRHKNDLLKSGVRAVKAEIADDAKYWTGYKNAVVNDGVTRYLYATYNK